MEQNLLNAYNSLPPLLQGYVNHYIEFLLQKYNIPYDLNNPAAETDYLGENTELIENKDELTDFEE